MLRYALVHSDIADQIRGSLQCSIPQILEQLTFLAKSF
jgi:hypothetical protein